MVHVMRNTKLIWIELLIMMFKCFTSSVSYVKPKQYTWCNWSFVGNTFYYYFEHIVEVTLKLCPFCIDKVCWYFPHKINNCSTIRLTIYSDCRWKYQVILAKPINTLFTRGELNVLWNILSHSNLSGEMMMGVLSFYCMLSFCYY